MGFLNLSPSLGGVVSLNSSLDKVRGLNPSLSGVVFVLFDLILFLPSTIFQLNMDGSSSVEPVLS